MSTTIDSLQIEIQSNSTNASSGINALADSLGKLKANGSIGVAVRNLEKLTVALRQFTSVSSNASKLRSLADAITKLSSAGSMAKTINQLSKLPSAVRGLDGLNLDGLDTKLAGVAQAASHLSEVKAGGLNSMVNGLSKIGDVTAKLDDATIAAFAAKVDLLSQKLTPLSQKMTTVSAGFKAINANAKSASSGMDKFSKKANATTFNLANFTTVMQGIISVLRPIINYLSGAVSEALEWDGIAQRFGRGFGEQAEEVYAWVKRLNEELGINTQQFMQYSSTYATMLTGFGVAQKDASNMALGYMELTYDIWAGYNDIYQSLDDAAMAVRSAIAGEVEPIRKAGLTITEATLKETAARHGLTVTLENATEAQKSYLRYLALTDAAMANGLVGTYAKEMNTAEGVMRTFSQQLKSLTQSLGSLFLPLLVEVMPWLQAFIELLTEAVHRVAEFFGIKIQDISGTWGDMSVSSGIDDIGAAADSATDSLGDTTGAIKDTTEALKDMKHATIGLDELNVIRPPSSNSGSGSGAGTDNGGWGDGSGSSGILGNMDSLWDDSIFDQIQFQVDDIKGKLEESLTIITAVITSFMLAIGTILVVSGANIPLGLGLMAVGAIGLVTTIASNWNEMSDRLAEAFTVITSVLAGFLLTIGALLAFTGVNVPLGVTLMAAGAVSLGTAVAINWKFLEGDLKNTLSILTGIISGALLVLGACFAFSGVDVPLGIALMAAGAVSLATTIGLNWDSMSEPMRKAIGVLEVIVGTGMLAIGGVLAFSGTNIPLGVALLAAGAVSIVSAVTLNWDSLTGNLKNSISTIVALLSGSLIAIGAILAFTGVATPLGVSLIAGGAVGLIGTAAVNWSSLTNAILKVLKEIGAAVGGALLALGAVLTFTGVQIPTGIALMAAGAVGIVSSVVLNWDTIGTHVTNVLKELGIVAGSFLMELGLILCASGVALPVGIALIAAGAVGLVSGVALNWDSLVNTISGVLKKIGIVAGTSMLALGLMLCLSGVAMPLGIGLIAAGAVGLASGVSLNWDTIVNQVKGTISKIGDAWDGLWDACVGGIKKMWDGVVGWFTNLWDVLVGHSIVPDTINAIVKWFTSLPGKIWGSVQSFVTGVIDKFKNLGSGLTEKFSSAWTAVKNWWGKKPGLSTYTPSIGSITEKLSDAWSSAKTWWTKSKSALSAYTPSIGSIKTKLSSAWSTAKTWWSKSKGALSYTPTIGSIKSKLQSAWSTAKTWWSKNVKLSIPSLSLKVSYSSASGWKKAVVKALDLPGWPSLKFAKNGGMFDAGSLIWAGEAGAEIVANAGGGKTGVMNVDQMSDAVYEGVYSAMLAAMRATSGGGNGEQAVNVFLDGRQITSSVEKRQHERGASLVGNQVYSY